MVISDVFSRFTAALKTWLDNWLAVPVCSYFYIPQPAYAQLVHAATMLSRWTRVAGPSAVKPSSSVSQKESTAPWGPTPAISGVPSCPDLGLPRASASTSAQVVSAQILHAIRAQVAAQLNLQIDICGTLDTMAARFEAAKEEMIAAQGVEWENDMWDLAAEHLRIKRARVEKWCEIVAMAATEGRVPVINVDDSIYEADRETMSVNGFEWLTSGYDMDDVQWESAMFDEMLRDIHPEDVVQASVDLPVDVGGLYMEVDQ